MQYGVFLMCEVPMPDAGAGPPSPTDRRTTNQLLWETTERIVDVGVEADRLGYEYFFFTEHHFQHEGFGVIPNGLMTGVVLSERTKRIKIGSLIHCISQWHPLRFAEDFATLHNFSRGRGVLAIGRGAVPREAMTLGAVVGSSNDPVEFAEQEAFNREKFAEAMDVIELALNSERFSYHGKHYLFPPDGIPGSGGFVEELTLTPRPIAPYERWQTITSPPTLEAVARRGYGGVWSNIHPEFRKIQLEEFARVWKDEHGQELAPGDQRMWVANIRVAETQEAAIAKARPGFDEYWKFLSPYGRSVGFKGPDGGPAPRGWVPTLEEAMEQHMCFVGTPDDVAGQLLQQFEELPVSHVSFFPMCTGESYGHYEDQIALIAEQVIPKLQ